MPVDDSRFQLAVARFQETHSEDPVTVETQDGPVPWSVHYHRRLVAWVRRLQPEASEALVLAAHCQHIRRWTIPRDRYPVGRAGYKRWRKNLAQFHAREAGRILGKAGYDEITIGRVRDLLRKLRLKLDPESQLLEDAVCLVFLENEFEAFSRMHDDAKLAGILRKTWRKMSPQGREAALAVAGSLPGSLQVLVRNAVAHEP
jgi:hypothetical protein